MSMSETRRVGGLVPEGPPVTSPRKPEDKRPAIGPHGGRPKTKSGGPIAALAEIFEDLYDLHRDPTVQMSAKAETVIATCVGLARAALEATGARAVLDQRPPRFRDRPSDRRLLKGAREP
jgi:hypothetical protein